MADEFDTLTDEKIPDGGNELAEAFTPKNIDSIAMRSFGSRLYNQWSINKNYRRAKEMAWLEDLRTYKGLYDPEVKIDENCSKVYPKITRSKVNIVLSRLHEMLFPDSERNWEILPTPEPRIAKETVRQIAESLIQQDPETGEIIPPTEEDLRLAISKFALETAEKMSNEIDDQFTEMDYSEETKKVLKSGLMFGTGIMKGPLISKRTKRRWYPIQAGSDFEENIEQEDVPDFQFVRIWDWYPDMSVTEYSKTEGSFERHIMTKHDLRGLMKREDFYANIIKEVLTEAPHGDYSPENWEVDLQVIEVEAGTGKVANSVTMSTGNITTDQWATNRQMGKKYQVLEYWGYVDGSDLAQCGLNIEDVTLEYAANVWILGGRVIKADLYDKALDQYKLFYYEKDETSLFGEGLARIMRHSQLAIAGGARMVLDNSACLTGDTEVYRRGKNRPSILSLNDLWTKSKQWKSGLRRNKIRCVDEVTGELVYARIVNIFNNGVRPVFELTTKHGYRIKATEDHKFMCETGEWQELTDFCIGDLIAVNGQSKRKTGTCIECGKATRGAGLRCRSCAMVLTHPPDNPAPKLCIECGTKTALRGVRCKKCAAKFENNSWNQKQAKEAAVNLDALATTARQRWACQKDKKDICERCGIKAETGISLIIHHIDRDPYNNIVENKMTLCQPCHVKVHHRHDYFGQPFQHKYVDYDEIVEIEYVGEEEVFDLEMEAPNHNFIANGFVAHNCVSGPNVEINYDLMEPDTDLNSFYPRKIWFRRGRGVDAQYPALRVYNIDSHIEELIKVIELFKNFGDEETTLPTWMIGQMANNETAQATSGRLSTITISIKDIVRNFDYFTEQIIRDLYSWNMTFNSRTDIKGDFLCKARGVSSLVMKEIRMQALTQLTGTMTPEEWEYIPKRDFLIEKLKAHDVRIKLLTDTEVAKNQEARKQSEEMVLAVEMQKAEVGYKKAQTMAQLTKAKKVNVEAMKDAQTPPETQPVEDSRLAEADLAGKMGEEERKEEAHQQDLRLKDEKHTYKLAMDMAKTKSSITTTEQKAKEKNKNGN